MRSDQLVEEFLRGLGETESMPAERVALLRSVVTSFVALAQSDPDDGDLRVASVVLDEMLQAARVFSPWRDHPKLTVFGSARVRPETALYDMARDLSRAMRDRGWITVSGAGPGIMEAAAQGAGREHTLGVNIDLPFEQSSNPYIDAETRLVEMQYFFTRKVALTKESLAFAFFPGGLGTMDEAFEILTLLHTGKSNPAPVVLLDTSDGRYWEQWLEFLNVSIVDAGYLEPRSVCLFRICHSLDEAITEIERFFRHYDGFETSGGRGRIRVRCSVSDQLLAHLTGVVPRFDEGQGFVAEDEHTISFDFDGRRYVSLRVLINVLNDWAG